MLLSSFDPFSLEEWSVLVDPEDCLCTKRLPYSRTVRC